MSADEIKAAVATAIFEALTITRMKRESLADEIGVRAATLKRWERGEVQDFTLLPVARLFKLARMSLDQAAGISSADAGNTAEIEHLKKSILRYELIIDKLTGMSQGGANATADQPRSPVIPSAKQMDIQTDTSAETAARKEFDSTIKQSLKALEELVEHETETGLPGLDTDQTE